MDVMVSSQLQRCREQRESFVDMGFTRYYKTARYPSYLTRGVSYISCCDL
jgi:hypothetical protein